MNALRIDKLVLIIVPKTFQFERINSLWSNEIPSLVTFKNFQIMFGIQQIIFVIRLSV